MVLLGMGLKKALSASIHGQTLSPTQKERFCIVFSICMYMNQQNQTFFDIFFAILLRYDSYISFYRN
ncbi:hypothetical protein EMIT040CA3_20376 [Bacillus pseudomycoides]